jgi:hypothetical protein
MDLTIPEHFSAIRSYIEQRYRADEAFRDIYSDYLAYLDAHRFWSNNSSDVAPVRRNEYAELVSELEKEVIQMLKNGKDNISLIMKNGKTIRKRSEKTEPHTKRRDNHEY